MIYGFGSYRMIAALHVRSRLIVKVFAITKKQVYILRTDSMTAAGTKATYTRTNSFELFLLIGFTFAEVPA